MLNSLTTYAVESRYPGVSTGQLEAKQAIKDCAYIRQLARKHLNLEGSVASN